MQKLYSLWQMTRGESAGSSGVTHRDEQNKRDQQVVPLNAKH